MIKKTHLENFRAYYAGGGGRFAEMLRTLTNPQSGNGESLAQGTWVLCYHDVLPSGLTGDLEHFYRRDLVADANTVNLDGNDHT